MSTEIRGLMFWDKVPPPSEEFLRRNKELAADNDRQMLRYLSIITGLWPFQVLHQGWKNRANIVRVSKEWIAKSAWVFSVLAFVGIFFSALYVLVRFIKWAWSD